MLWQPEGGSKRGFALGARHSVSFFMATDRPTPPSSRREQPRQPDRPRSALAIRLASLQPDPELPTHVYGEHARRLWVERSGLAVLAWMDLARTVEQFRERRNEVGRRGGAPSEIGQFKRLMRHRAAADLTRMPNLANARKVLGEPPASLDPMLNWRHVASEELSLERSELVAPDSYFDSIAVASSSTEDAYKAACQAHRDTKRELKTADEFRAELSVLTQETYYRFDEAMLSAAYAQIAGLGVYESWEPRATDIARGAEDGPPRDGLVRSLQFRAVVQSGIAGTKHALSGVLVGMLKKGAATYVNECANSPALRGRDETRGSDNGDTGARLRL